MDSLKFLVSLNVLDKANALFSSDEPASCTLKLNRNDWERLGRPADILLVTSPVFQGLNGPLA